MHLFSSLIGALALKYDLKFVYGFSKMCDKDCPLVNSNKLEHIIVRSKPLTVSENYQNRGFRN